MRRKEGRKGLIARLTGRLPHPWNQVADWAVTIVFAVAVVLVVKTYVVNPYRIPSSSMEPTFHCAVDAGSGCLGGSNDRVLANRFIWHFSDPRRGDVVVFEAPQEAAQACGQAGTYVKRLIGLPGETVSATAGEVFVNGEKLDEPYLSPEVFTDDFAPVTLAADEYWMMGDNRESSCDSRRWGPATEERLVGPVFFVYWPVSRIGFR
jgi:signal peptidase I